MAKKYQNKYRIESARLQNWDYRREGAYFITICTKNRKHYFGKIKNGKMEFSNIGIIADILWSEIINHNDNIELGEFVVMPNHIHGILILNNNNTVVVETLHATSLRQRQQQTENKNDYFSSISPKSNSISTIIRSYKSAVTKHCHRLGFEFGWQTRFWEHIIRNNDEFYRISQYIIDNPLKWENDKLNGGNGNIVMENVAEYNSEIWMI